MIGTRDLVVHHQVALFGRSSLQWIKDMPHDGLKGGMSMQHSSSVDREKSVYSTVSSYISSPLIGLSPLLHSSMTIESPNISFLSLILHRRRELGVKPLSWVDALHVGAPYRGGIQFSTPTEPSFECIFCHASRCWQTDHMLFSSNSLKRKKGE